MPLFFLIYARLYVKEGDKLEKLNEFKEK
jgi:hypothetical protein